MADAPKAANEAGRQGGRKAKRQRRPRSRNKQSQKQQPEQQQGHYADPLSPIASTPMKRQRTKAAESSKSIKAKYAPSSASSSNNNGPESKEAAKFLSPRKLLKEYDEEQPKAKKVRPNPSPETPESKLNGTKETATTHSSAGEDEADDELFSPALKPPRASRSSSVPPADVRVRLETKFAGASAPPAEKLEDVETTNESTAPATVTADGEDMDEDDAGTDQEFNPFFFMKTLPKYEDIVVGKRPISLPERSRSAPKICLVLDLDETLVHCSVDEVKNPHLQFPVTFNGVEYTVNVKKRPHMEYFLKRVSKLFEIVVFTASHKVYAEKLMNLLDPNRNLIKYRLYRDDCLDVFGNYLKDLNVLGRDLSKVLLVDNSPHAFGYQVNNGIPIETWYDDEGDAELLNLLPFLEGLVGVDDVRPIVEKQFQIQKLIDATPDEII
ncbi:CTD small phosphatase-like protein 2 [Phytophthora boehmeriae]|uniref:CTD small phosphatase-like protein 2 n=1 Tax=Phytophthora boehmeriae TaxID=109152 RepID=A0A8T1WUA0_9STRA|nr:CTD small phosphatase-like protein 2 [Phytophthora boehmeriae]